MTLLLQTREDYVTFVETLYFGAIQAGRTQEVLAYFAPGAVLTGYAGDAPPRILARVPQPGQGSLDDFMHAASRFDLTYLDFEHYVDAPARRIASHFTLLLRPKSGEGRARRMRNCNFFQFGEGGLTGVLAYFANPGGA